MGDEKKTPLEELLKSLEGHVVDSVEISHETIEGISEDDDRVLHVRISATELDPKYPEHVRLNPKDLSFSIVDAWVLSRILDWVASRVQDNIQSIQRSSKTSSEILSNLKKKEISITRDLSFSLMSVRKLLDFIKGTITETLRIRKRVEKKEETDD